MKIKTFSIRNYKCIGEKVEFDFSENILVLVGENNVGKSSILDALQKFFSGTKTIDPELFHDQKSDEDNAIEIEVLFDSLSAEDKEHQAVKPYIGGTISNPTWYLRKKYFRTTDGKSECEHWTKDKDGVDKKNPGGLSSNPNDLFTNEKMQIVKLDAVKNVSDETSSKGKSSFGQIFQMVVTKAIEGNSEYINLLSALSEYQKIFSEGKKIPEIESLENEITIKLNRTIQAVGKISVDAPKLGSAVMPVPALMTNDNREIDVLPEYQGNGLQRVLIFCLLELLAEKTSPSAKTIGPQNLLLIEEPELYLHPQMERKVSDTLYKISEDNQAQVIIATHSPVFINIENEPLALCRMVRNESDNGISSSQHADMFTEATKEDQRKRLRMILAMDPSVNEVFFAKRVVLVEGDTEITVFKESAVKLKIFDEPENIHKKRDTTFVNCRGKWTICTFQEILNSLEIPYVIFHDKDSNDNGDLANAKILSLSHEGESQRMVFDTKIEDQLDLTDIGKDKPFRAYEKIQAFTDAELESKFGKYVRFAYGISEKSEGSV